MGRVAVFYLRDIEAAIRALTGLGMIDRRSRESQDLESSICILSLLLGDDERADALISGFFAGNPPEDLRARVRRAISEKRQNQGRVSPLSNE